LHEVHAALVASCAVIGVGVGAVLDPVGQRLADRSRAAEERRRLERVERRDDVPASTDAVPPADDAEPDPAAAGPVRHLLPEGRSVPRTVGAALATGALFALAAGHYGAHLVLVPFLVFLAMAVTVSVTDLTHRLVPRHLVYGALALIVPLLVATSAQAHAWRPLVDAAIAGAGGFAVFFLIWFFVPRGMGFGDVRLAGVIGTTVGYLDLFHAYLAFLVGFLFGLAFGLVLMVGSSAGRKTRIPFAPALCIGAVVAILWGDPLVNHLFHSGA
jgi:leader peptidase (prepilin peptidase)/N-methyltransferase